MCNIRRSVATSERGVQVVVGDSSVDTPERRYSWLTGVPASHVPWLAKVTASSTACALWSSVAWMAPALWSNKDRRADMSGSPVHSFIKRCSQRDVLPGPVNEDMIVWISWYGMFTWAPQRLTVRNCATEFGKTQMLKHLEMVGEFPSSNFMCSNCMSNFSLYLFIY